MTVLELIFYVLSATAVISALMVVAAKSPVHGVLFLVLTFFASSGVWMLLNAEFLALILVLVYVGAVKTLFSFVDMMLSMRIVQLQEGFVRYLPIAGLIVLLMVGLIVMVLSPSHFGLSEVAAPLSKPADYSNIAELGATLYTVYAYPFEIAAALLLTAIVAAIALAYHKPKERKSQNTAQQISVRRDQRVRLVKMPVEKKK